MSISSCVGGEAAYTYYAVEVYNVAR